MCVSSSSDPTAEVSSLLALEVSAEEREDEEDMRDLVSRPSRTCRRGPLLRTPSLLLFLFPWTVNEI